METQLQPSSAALLPLETIQMLHWRLAGEPVLEAAVLSFIECQYGAPSLLYLTPRTAAQIIKRPRDFLGAVARLNTPELPF